jgi:hypothetical protein
MKHERLSKALDSVWEAGCVIYREHYSYGKSQILILNPFCEQLGCELFVTGATDQQCAYIEKIMNNWKGI